MTKKPPSVARKRVEPAEPPAIAKIHRAILNLEGPEALGASGSKTVAGALLELAEIRESVNEKADLSLSQANKVVEAIIEERSKQANGTISALGRLNIATHINTCKNTYKG